MSKAITVDELMTRTWVSLKPDMDMLQAIQVLLKNKVSGAMVTDDKGELLGMLSEKDCLRIFVNGAYNSLPNTRVASYMTPIMTTVSPADDLFSVAEIFLKKPFRRLPVVENGVLVGQISRRDVLNGSRRLWEGTPAKKEWPDSKYIPDELRARLNSKGSA